ncbi:MAG: hypothetical protein RL291_738, partial [Pseudomonadota bacterium]
MSYDLTRPQQTLAVVGAGTMGRGIAQVAAMGNPDLGGGMNVLILDEKPGASAEAKEAIGRVLSQLAEKGRITADVARDTMARITPVEALDSIARADVIVEAIVERLDVKQMLFERLDQLCPPTTILASNTSSIPITAIAARASRP